MKIFRYLMVGTSMLALNASGYAATVMPIEGPLQVNTGSGFHKVTGAEEVAPGGSVMVGPGGSAEILYSDGCKIPVRPDSVAVVAPVSPCAQAQGAGLGIGNGVPGEPFNPGGYYVLGALTAIGAGVGIGCAIWCRQERTNIIFVAAPSSP